MIGELLRLFSLGSTLMPPSSAVSRKYVSGKIYFNNVYSRYQSRTWLGLASVYMIINISVVSVRLNVAKLKAS